MDYLQTGQNSPAPRQRLCRKVIVVDATSYRSFADLQKHQVLGKDYDIVVCHRASSRVAVIAPHGGGIERRTSEIARAISGMDLNLYLFEGIKSSGNNYTALHLTSHRFDEPSCLDLIAQCLFVVSVHGCSGNDKKVLLGGLDLALKAQLAEALAHVGVAVETDGHAFPATDRNNICNRGRSRKGVQLEITGSLRGSPEENRVVSAVRSVLLGLDASA